MKYIIGIDEVGRGALAGPVVVSAAAIPWNLNITAPFYLQTTNKKQKRLPLRDSKKLNPKQRDVWFEYFKKHPKVFYAIAKVHAKTIDGMNISQAANLAALRAFERLCARYQVSGIKSQVFLDGGLFLGNGKKRNRKGKTVIKGDEKITAIKIASIMAKVYRDRLMKRLGKKYPHYHFETHKGYGTKKHFAAIRRHGSSKIHRTTFLKGLRPT